MSNYDFKTVPPGSSVIDWEATANALNREVRALQSLVVILCTALVLVVLQVCFK